MMESGARKFTFKKKPTTNLKPPEVSDLLNSLQAIIPESKSEPKLQKQINLPFKSPPQSVSQKEKFNNYRLNRTNKKYNNNLIIDVNFYFNFQGHQLRDRLTNLPTV